ncbi:50S ribosomal protein L18 [Caldisericum exile]|uniref:Large ribosomal subunit protein uL18 n=1 Tax=Caldisericum exile (strain DSM 21853 / NBRC 104410 / AZM16c01) TaxID=511051 RepID=A0A7U6GF87_CALEA|nr:50S ribosomal protein L18 [Caldisericum exile]BAL81251.1 50S ribosomal protein L18 [Caldisericum exile AZM16c01]
MIKITPRNELRKIRHKRIRKKVFGTESKPRLSLFISLKHVYAQLIDDEHGRTLVSASTLDKDLKETVKDMSLTEKAKAVGKLIAERALAKGIETVVFDRSGYKYHGRVKALADEARNAGLKF